MTILDNLHMPSLEIKASLLFRSAIPQFLCWSMLKCLMMSPIYSPPKAFPSYWISSQQLFIIVAVRVKVDICIHSRSLENGGDQLDLWQVWSWGFLQKAVGLQKKRWFYSQKQMFENSKICKLANRNNFLGWRTFRKCGTSQIFCFRTQSFFAICRFADLNFLWT